MELNDIYEVYNNHPVHMLRDICFTIVKHKQRNFPKSYEFEISNWCNIFCFLTEFIFGM